MKHNSTRYMLTSAKHQQRFQTTRYLGFNQRLMMQTAASGTQMRDASSLCQLPRRFMAASSSTDNSFNNTMTMDEYGAGLLDRTGTAEAEVGSQGVCSSQKELREDSQEYSLEAPFLYVCNNLLLETQQNLFWRSPSSFLVTF